MCSKKDNLGLILRTADNPKKVTSSLLITLQPLKAFVIAEKNAMPYCTLLEDSLDEVSLTSCPTTSLSRIFCHIANASHIYVEGS
jgi:hypothetical protein